LTVCILGGGIIGLFCAWEATERGLEVIVIERGQPGGDSCSQGNAGMIVPSHFIPLAAPGMVSYGLSQLGNPESPFWVRPRLSLDLLDWGWKFMRASTKEKAERAGPLLRDLNNASRAAYDRLADAFENEFGLVKRGLLMLTRTEHALDEENAVAERARALGIPAEALTPEEAARLDPNVIMDIAGAVYFPNDCHLTPQKLTAGLTRRLTERGVRFFYDATVHHLEAASGRVAAAVLTRTSDPALLLPKAESFIEADQFVLAGGAWSSEIARSIGLKLPMQAGKGYSLTLRTPPQLPEICSILTEARVAVTPMGSTLRVGGTMEIAGNDLSVSESRVRGIVQSVPLYYPRFSESDFEGVKPWRGLRPCTPDGLPYLGRPRLYKNLVVATGHAMMGLSLAPVTGQLVGDLLMGATPAIPLNLLDPDRYGNNS
jgi:D-amino-acid dehydrogenase